MIGKLRMFRIGQSKTLKHLQMPIYLVTVIFLTVTVYAGASVYLIIKKDNEVEKYRRMEIELQNQIKERDLFLQQNRQQIEQLEKRFEILNAVRQLSSADVSHKDQLKIAKTVDTISQKYGQDPFLLLALMSSESSLRPWAKSDKGAGGLMQIMPQTGKALIARVLDDPALIGSDHDDDFIPPNYKNIEGNIQLGTLYFTNLLLRYQNLEHAIMAYNLGPTIFDKRIKSGGSLPIKYAEKVIKTYRRLLQSNENHDIPFPQLAATFPHETLLARADF